MIKGDLRKKQILETAERLFTEHGYERTGVQDILDVLNLSKGSFYHHFASKELVLLTICESRAELSAAHYRAEETENGLERMNRLLSGMIPFQGEGLAFLKMLMPVFLLPEGRKSGGVGMPLARKRLAHERAAGSGGADHNEG